MELVGWQVFIYWLIGLKLIHWFLVWILCYDWSSPKSLWLSWWFLLELLLLFWWRSLFWGWRHRCHIISFCQIRFILERIVFITTKWELFIPYLISFLANFLPTFTIASKQNLCHLFCLRNFLYWLYCDVGISVHHLIILLTVVIVLLLCLVHLFKIKLKLKNYI